MQNKDINVSIRILILFLLSICILVAKSVYLIIFMSILFIILFILTGKSVNNYTHLLKNLKFWLLFLFVIYIIIFRNILGSFIFLYKLILIICIVKQFTLTVKFSMLNNGIKTLLKPLSQSKVNLDKLSYDITISLYFIGYYITIDDCYKRYNIIQNLFLAASKINKLENSLQLKYYRPKYEEVSLKSIIIFIMFIVLFVLIIIKEVIL